eukprot:CAMPEP_0183809396 /NCGR_PEP_ID=MMETSP0803_2-20130417/45390_1 /TAXON_ID=195967 /ORGANISM="Crustomastix stigmata, Strain CCMP3273" /LENGTH=32 /DNA_ID= /DNA_START= /DNA_END= /DNA_ORIENTATION=
MPPVCTKSTLLPCHASGSAAMSLASPRRALPV